MRFAGIVDGDKGVPVEISPPTGRTLFDHLRASVLQVVADLHEERGLAVARITREQDKTHVPTDNRLKQLRVEQRWHIGVTGELVIQASIACVADAAASVKPSQAVHYRVGDSFSRTRRDFLDELELASQFVS